MCARPAQADSCVAVVIPAATCLLRQSEEQRAREAEAADAASFARLVRQTEFHAPARFLLSPLAYTHVQSRAALENGVCGVDDVAVAVAVASVFGSYLPVVLTMWSGNRRARTAASSRGAFITCDSASPVAGCGHLICVTLLVLWPDVDTSFV